MVHIFEFPSQFPRNIWNSFLLTTRVKGSRPLVPPLVSCLLYSTSSSQQTLAHGLLAHKSEYKNLYIAQSQTISYPQPPPQQKKNLTRHLYNSNKNCNPPFLYPFFTKCSICLCSIGARLIFRGEIVKLPGSKSEMVPPRLKELASARDRVALGM